jgi:hypothetical protein
MSRGDGAAVALSRSAITPVSGPPVARASHSVRGPISPVALTTPASTPARKETP